jgi:hypothetical protein
MDSVAAGTPQHTGYVYDQAISGESTEYFLPTVSMEDLWGSDVSEENGVVGWFRCNIRLILLLTVDAREIIVLSSQLMENVKLGSRGPSPV